MTRHHLHAAIKTLLILATAAAVLGGPLAAAALADSGGMAGMPGMTDEQMQNMTTPAPTATASAMPAATPSPAATGMSGAMPAVGDQQNGGAMDGSMPAGSTQTGKLAPAMGQDMVMAKGSVNWFVIGGFLAIVAGSTVAAMGVKRRLRARMAAGGLAGAGVQSV